MVFLEYISSIEHKKDLFWGEFFLPTIPTSTSCMMLFKWDARELSWDKKGGECWTESVLLNTSPNNHHVVLGSNCPGQKQPPITSTTSTTPTTPPSPTQHQLHLFHFQHCHNHVILRPTSLIKIILLDAIKNFLTSNFLWCDGEFSPIFSSISFCYICTPWPTAK